MKIDFHAHILPRTDHGCDGSLMAHRQLLLMREAGTDAVVATPHFYPNHDSVESFLDRREGALYAMQQKLPLADLPTVYPAAEVLVCVGIDKMPGLERLAVSGTNVILLEMPFTYWGEELIETVKGVRARGLLPVLAHIDRYPPEAVAELMQLGFLAQVNAEAFGALRSTRVLCRYMEEGKVVALGSDLHGDMPRSYKRFLLMQRKLGTLADAVFARSAELLADAAPLPAHTAQTPVPKS